MPRMRGRGCMLPYRISGAVLLLPRTLNRTVTFGVETIHIGSQVLAAGLGLGVCPFCSLEVETSLHAFRGYSDASEALRLDDFPDSIIFSHTTSIFDWLLKTTGSLSREAFTKFLLILWNLSNRRNLWVHDSRLQSVSATVTTTTLLHEDFFVANDGLKKLWSKPILSSPTWSPPLPETMAIPVDGAFIQDRGAGVGVVARDSRGRALGGLAQHSPGLDSPIFAEAAAVHAGLLLARERGWGKVIL
ncbi:hypothetical protein V6N11_039703 [Hibiscus sabdariffa]